MKQAEYMREIRGQHLEIKSREALINAYRIQGEKVAHILEQMTKNQTMMQRYIYLIMSLVCIVTVFLILVIQYGH